MKKITQIFALCAFLLAGLSTYAQQDAIYDLYLFNPVVINPAYGGSLDEMQANASFRRQWTNFPGSPSTAVLSLTGPVKNSEKSGCGLTFINDRIGNIKTTGFSSIYTYKIKLSNSKLAFGVQSTIRNFSVDFGENRLSSANLFDEAFSQNVSSWHLNFGTGAFWYSDNWYVGLSIPHLRAHRIGPKEESTDALSRQRGIYMLNGGYVFEISDEWKLKPALLFRFPSGAPMQADITTNAYFNDILSFGLGYRTRAALQIMGDVKVLKNMRVGYAFDQVTSKLTGQAGGSHELMVRYYFTWGSSKEITNRVF